MRSRRHDCSLCPGQRIAIHRAAQLSRQAGPGVPWILGSRLNPLRGAVKTATSASMAKNTRHMRHTGINFIPIDCT